MTVQELIDILDIVYDKTRTIDVGIVQSSGIKYHNIIDVCTYEPEAVSLFIE